MDLFETMRVLVGADFISDLWTTPYRELAREEICQMDLQTVELQDLRDMAGYLYGEKVAFQSTSEAETFFAGREQK